MTKKVFKYPLTHSINNIDLPDGAQVLTVQMQGNEVMMWALVDPNALPKRREFQVVETGQKFTFDDRTPPVYIETVQMGVMVWHVFEIV